jgi:hypothetical protein
VRLGVSVAADLSGGQGCWKDNKKGRAETARAL